MADTLLLVGSAVCGAFTVVLGLVHVVMPWLFDFDGAIPTDGPALEPMAVGPFTYETRRQDVRGVAQIMTHATSYVLVTVGVVDLFVTAWFDAWVAPYTLVWIAGWWFLRAANQRHMGHRRADWLIAGGFALLGLFHLVAAWLRLATTSSPGL